MTGHRTLRVHFDEMMSADVADALRKLDKDVTRVRKAAKAMPDRQVARRAKAQGRYVFTNNFDMVLAAYEEDADFIWFYDQSSNALTKFDTARLFFARWNRWEELLGRDDVSCLRVSRHRTTPTTPQRAMIQARRVVNKRRRAQASAAQTALSFED